MLKYEPVSTELQGDNPLTLIRIMEGPYLGAVFHYGSVTFPEIENVDDNTETVNCTFEFNVCDVTDLAEFDTIESLQDCTDFQNVIGDLLVDILTESTQGEK